MSPEPVTMYLLFPEMSQLSTEDDSLDCRGGGRGGGSGREVEVRRGQCCTGWCRLLTTHAMFRERRQGVQGHCQPPRMSLLSRWGWDRTWDRRAQSGSQEQIGNMSYTEGPLCSWKGRTSVTWTPREREREHCPFPGCREEVHPAQQRGGRRLSLESWGLRSTRSASFFW